MEVTILSSHVCSSSEQTNLWLFGVSLPLNTVMLPARLSVLSNVSLYWHNKWQHNINNKLSPKCRISYNNIGYLKLIKVIL